MCMVLIVWFVLHELCHHCIFLLALKLTLSLFFYRQFTSMLICIITFILFYFIIFYFIFYHTFIFRIWRYFSWNGSSENIDFDHRAVGLQSHSSSGEWWEEWHGDCRWGGKRVTGEWWEEWHGDCRWGGKRVTGEWLEEWHGYWRWGEKRKWWKLWYKRVC